MKKPSQRKYVQKDDLLKKSKRRNGLKKEFNKCPYQSFVTCHQSNSLTLPIYIWLKDYILLKEKKASREDLLYDTKEFLRKMELKAFFNEHPCEKSTKEEEHKILRVPSKNHPVDFSNATYNEIKTRLMGFVSNLEWKAPKSNLSNAERRGKTAILKLIDEKKNLCYPC